MILALSIFQLFFCAVEYTWKKLDRVCDMCAPISGQSDLQWLWAGTAQAVVYLHAYVPTMDRMSTEAQRPATTTQHSVKAWMQQSISSLFTSTVFPHLLYTWTMLYWEGTSHATGMLRYTTHTGILRYTTHTGILRYTTHTGIFRYSTLVHSWRDQVSSSSGGAIIKAR